MNAGDDLDLRERFRALREADQRRMPSLERVLARHRGARTWVPRPSFAPATLAVMLIVTVVSISLREEPGGIITPHDGEAFASILHWSAPTDILLHTPGREFTASVPRIGETTLALDTRSHRP
ncbi:MAG: hypothetical protein L0271_27790 [Gemmatimonadetes bacterium]|nr:hypothetical protein [Gemmatimonadota bacterium]